MKKAYRQWRRRIRAAALAICVLAGMGLWSGTAQAAVDHGHSCETRSGSYGGPISFSAADGQRDLSGEPEISTGKWTITVPAQYKVLCYPSCTSTDHSTYLEARDEPYGIPCTQRAVFPDGRVRYFFVSEKGRDL